MSAQQQADAPRGDAPTVWGEGSEGDPRAPASAGRDLDPVAEARSRPTLLIVEDDTFWRRWYIDNLSDDFTLRFAGDARTAVQRVVTYRPVAIICDRHINPIPKGPVAVDGASARLDRTIAAKSYVDGWQFLRQLRKSIFRATPVVLVTDDGPGGMNWVRMKILQPDGFITKGKIARDELLSLLRDLIERRAGDTSVV